MTRSELIDLISRKNKAIPAETVEKIVIFLFNQLATGLAAQTPVRLRGFGAFTVRKYIGYEGTHPRTQTKITVPDYYQIVFKASASLTQRLTKRSAA